MPCSCMIDVDVDYGDMAKVSRNEIRTARKEHRCYECNKPIRPGEKYESNTAMYEDHGWSTTKTCHVCLELRKCFLCNWYYGGVLDEIREAFDDIWDELKICILDQLGPEARDWVIEMIDERLEDDDE
jgi:uncharacterized protein with PIN domain